MSQDEAPRTDTVVTDPERLRALAHPIRVRLFDLLSDRGEATATECAEAIGESVASCSFHLRMLAKYGYIERADARGREKPWRLAAPSWTMRPESGSATSLRAAQELAQLSLDAEWQRARAFLAQIEREDEAWVRASVLVRSGFWATAEELQELSRDLQAISERFAGRGHDPSTRPPGARFARMAALVNPEPIAGDER